MINLDRKIASPLPFKKTCPCTTLLPPFKIFSDSAPPSPPSPLKKEGGGGESELSI